MTDGTAFTVECRRSADVLRITVAGDLDLLTEPELVTTVRDALTTTDADRMVLDLNAVEFIDSSGLRALLRCQDAARRSDVALTLAVAEGPVAGLLRIAGVTERFRYE